MTRRQLILGAILAACAAVCAALLAFGHKFISFLISQPGTKPIFEPSIMFGIGPVSDFDVGVSTKFLQQHRVCVVRNSKRLYVIHARCTHQGCTPDWVARDNRFKCPCHASSYCMGSAFDGEGINCEGPAPRPLDRAHVELNSEGQIVVNTSKLYEWPKGGRSEFDDGGAYITID